MYTHYLKVEFFFLGKEFDINYFRKKTLKNKDETQSTAKDEPAAVATEDDDTTVDYFPMDVNCLSRSTRKFGNEEKLPKLIRLYNLTDFVLLTSENPNAVTSETHVKLLMSSFCISAFNTRWFVRTRLCITP